MFACIFWCLPDHVSLLHRYLVASSPDTIYVSFIGTKLAKDVLVDANFFHKPLWKAEKTEQVGQAGCGVQACKWLGQAG